MPTLSPSSTNPAASYQSAVVSVHSLSPPHFPSTPVCSGRYANEGGGAGILLSGHYHALASTHLRTNSSSP